MSRQVLTAILAETHIKLTTQKQNNYTKSHSAYFGLIDPQTLAKH